MRHVISWPRTFLIITSKCRSQLFAKFDSQAIRSEFTGALKDDWSLPCAHYEMAVLSWYEKDLKDADRDAKVLDCESWLEKCAKWDTYTMDARIGVRVGTAKDTVSRYKAKYL